MINIQTLDGSPFIEVMIDQIGDSTDQLQAIPYKRERMDKDKKLPVTMLYA